MWFVSDCYCCLVPKKGSSSDTDKSLIRMRAGLKSMLDDLKVKIDSTEKVRQCVLLLSH